MKISVNLTLVVGKIDMWATPYMKFLNKLEFFCYWFFSFLSSQVT